MGLVIKLAISLIIFTFKKTFLLWKRKYKEHITARYSYLEHTTKNKHGHVISHILAIPFKSSLYFNIYPENSGSRWLKKCGLAYEFQTGDTAFDEEYFLAIDHYYMIKLLREQKQIRDLIQQVFHLNEMTPKNFKVLEIFSDGDVLGIKFNAVHLSENLIYKLYEFKKNLQDMLKEGGHRFVDHFFSKQMIVDGIVLSFVTYAFSSLIEYFYATQYLHATRKILFNGSYLSVIIFTLLFLFYKKLMSGSARSHMSFWWNFIASALSLVIICSQTLLDLNIYFDRSEIKQYSTFVNEKVEQRRRRSRNYYLDLTFSEKNFPYYIKVPEKVYSNTPENKDIIIEYRSGYLGYPYLVSINGVKL